MVNMFCVTDMHVASSSFSGNADGKIEWWLLGSRLLSVVGIENGSKGYTELVLWKGKVIGTRLYDIYVISQGTYVGTYVIWIEPSTDGTVDDNTDSFIIIYCSVSLDVSMIGTSWDTEL